MMKINEVTIPVGKSGITATISKPDVANSIVIFAHGLGSSRFSPRNVRVAKHLQEAGFATLLCDLHNNDERNKDDIHFDLHGMAQRLELIILWLKNQTQYETLDLALFGSSTGAAVAVKVSAELQGVIKALVCRGGRLNLAREYLDKITAPTLLIVGELDFKLLEAQNTFLRLLNTKKELAIIPGASHLFEEPNKLDEVGKISVEWFTKFLKHPEYQAEKLEEEPVE